MERISSVWWYPASMIPNRSHAAVHDSIAGSQIAHDPRSRHTEKGFVANNRSCDPRAPDRFCTGYRFGVPRLSCRRPLNHSILNALAYLNYVADADHQVGVRKRTFMRMD